MATFVLANGGPEIGRILGHPGNEAFYGLLGESYSSAFRGNRGMLPRQRLLFSLQKA